MPLGTPNQDVGLFQPGSLIPKASPVRSEREEEEFSPRVAFLNTFQRLEMLKSPISWRGLKLHIPIQQCGQPDVELKAKILSHEMNLKLSQVAGWC